MATTKNGGQIKFGIDFQVNRSGLNEVSKSIKDIINQAQKMSSSNPMKTTFQQAASEAKKLESIINSSWNNKLKQLNLDKFNQSVKNSYGSVEGLKKSLQAAGPAGQTAFNNLAHSVLNTNLQLRESNKLLDEMATSMANTVKWGITSSIFNNITSAIQSSFYYAKDLDRQLNNIRIVTGDSADQMQRFAKTANSAAKELGRSTLDYTKAATAYYQQGLGGEEVQARSQVTLKAQNITGVGSEMVDYLTAVWNGFGATTEQVESYVDKLAKVADSSASDMSQLAIAMSKVASTANVMGVDIDQLTAQLGTVIAVTRQAPEAVGTAFKTIYSRLNDIATGAEDAEISLGNYSGKLASLGFNVLDANGRLRETGQVMEQIGSRWDTLSKEQQIYLGQIMGGMRQVNQITSLFENWDMYSELLNDSLNAEGTLLQKNNIYLESTAAHMQKLGAQSERTADLLFDQDTVNTFVDALNKGLTLFNDYIAGLGSGTNAFVHFGTTVANIFSNQIGKAINNQIKNLQVLKQNAEAFKMQGSFSESVLNDVKMQHTAQGQIVSQSALEKQAQIAQKTLQVRKALTQEEYNRLIQSQQQIGIAQTQIDYLEQYRTILQDNNISEEASVQIVKDNVNYKKEELNAQKLIADYIQLSLIPSSVLTQEQRERVSAAQDLLLEQGEEVEILMGISDEQEEIIKKLQTEVLSDDQIKQLLNQQKVLIEEQQQRVGKLNQALRGRQAEEDGTLQRLKDQQRARQQNVKQQQDIAARQIIIQKTVKATTATVQGLTALVGGISTYLDDASTGAEKLNGWFTAASGSVSAIANYFIPGSGFLVQGAATLVKTIAQAAGWWDSWENSLKSVKEKIEDLKENIKSINDINKTENSKINSLQSMIDQYKKLSSAAGAYGINLDKMTIEEQNRYHQLTNEFSQYNTAVITGYDEQGNAIVKGQQALLDTIQVLKQAKKEATTASMNLDQIFSGIRAKGIKQDLKNELELAQEDLNNYLSANNIDVAFVESFNKGVQEEFNALGEDTQNHIEKELRELMQRFGSARDDALRARWSGDFEQANKKMAQALGASKEIVELIKKTTGKTDEQLNTGLQLYRDNWNETAEKVAEIKQQAIDELTEKLSEKTNYDLESANVLIQIIQNYIGQDEQWNALQEQASKIGIPISTIEKMLVQYVQTFDSAMNPEDVLANLQGYAQLLSVNLESAYSEINKAIKENNIQDFEGTIKQAQTNISNALSQIFASDAYKELTQEGKESFQSLVKTMFSLSDLEIDPDTNEVEKFTTETVNALQNAINTNIGKGSEEGLTDTIINYLIGNFKESEINGIIAAVKSTEDGVFQTFNDFLNWLKDYQEQIKQLDAQEQSGIVISKIDKIISSIQKLQNGKDLKHSEKQQFIAEGILSEQEVNTIQSRVAFIQKLMQKIYTIKDPSQRQEYIGQLFTTLNDLSVALKDNIITAEDYDAVWQQVYQNEIDALKIDNEFLEEYAKNKKLAFNSQQERQQVLNLYKQSQGLDKIKSSFKGLIDDIKNDNFTSSINDFITSLNEITGQNVDFTWLKDNIETVKILFEDTNISADQLLNSLTLLSQGKNIDLPETTKLQQDSNRYDLAKSAYDKLNSGKVGEITSEERQALIYLQQQNQQLQQKDRYSKQYTEELRKQLQIQKESLEKERQEAITQKRNWIAALNESKASISGELDSLEQDSLRRENQENEARISQLRQWLEYIEDKLIIENEQLLDLQQQQAAAAEQKNNKLKEQIQTFNSIRDAAENNKTLSDQQIESLSSILDTVLQRYPQLNQAADILKDKWLVGTDAYKQALGQVNQALHQIQLDDLNTSMEEIFESLSEDLDNLKIGVDPSDFESFMDQVNNFLDLDKQLTITVHSNAIDEFEHMSNELDKVYNAAGKIGQNFIIAANDIREVSNVFPGILQGMQMLDDGSIQLNSNIVQRAIGTAQTEVQADAQATAEKIRNQGELLIQKSESYRRMEQAARIMAQAQLDSSIDSTQAQSILSDELTKQESLNQQLTAQNALDNDEKIATSAQQNAEITGENWASEISYAAACVTEFANVAMNNFAQVAKAAAAAEAGYQYVPYHYVYNKPGRTSSARQGVRGTASSLENQANTISRNALNGNATYQNLINAANAYGTLADLTGAKGRDLLAAYSQLMAQGESTAQALNNVAQGYGIGGKKEDKTSNSSSNNSGKSGSGDLTDGGEDLLTDGTDQQPPDPQILQFLEEERDRYHDINIVLENISTALKRVEKQQSKLTGKDLVKNLNRQLKILQAQKVAQQEKLKIAKQEAQEIRDLLSGKGVNFDEFGNISNYADILNEKQKAINDAIKYYNSLTVEEQQAYKATIQQLKQDYEDFKKTIERYDTLVTNQIPNLQDNITDTINEKFEAQISKFRLQIELDLDTTEAQRKYNDFRRKVVKNLDQDDTIRQAYSQIDDLFTFYGQKQWLKSPIVKYAKETTDALSELQQEEDSLLQDDSFEEFLEQLDQSFNDREWFDDPGILEELDNNGNPKKGFKLSKLDTLGGQVGVLTQQIYNDLAELRDIDTKGSSKVYGTDRKSAVQHLKQDMNNLMSSMEQAQQMINNIENSIFDVIGQIQESFDEQLQQIGFINDAIDHGRQLTQMIYGDKAFDQMQHFYQVQQQNDNRQVDFLRRQTNFWRQKLENAKKDLDSMNQNEEGYLRAKKLVSQYQNLWMDSARNLNATVESSVQNLINKYQNAVEKIFDKLDKKVTGQRGIQKVAQDWELINTQADRYLDAVNTAYEITKLQNAFEEAINDNEGNLSAQSSLRDLMNQQLKLLKDKEKVSQYDVDRANALLQIEMKRLALQDRRNNKTKLRLRRDSQGNYNYQYVADEGDAAKTQEQLQKAQIDLYNLTKKSMIDNQKELLSTYKDWQSAVKEVTLDTTLSVEDQNKRIEELNRYYGAIINDITTDNYEYRKYLSKDAYDSLAQTYLNDKTNFENTLFQEEKLMQGTYNNKFSALYLANVQNFDDMTQAEKEILMQKMVPQWDTSIETMAKAFTGPGGFAETIKDSFKEIAGQRDQYSEDLDKLEEQADVNFGKIQDDTDYTIEKTLELIQDNDELLSKEQAHLQSIYNIIDAVRELKQTWEGAKTAGERAVSVANDYIAAHNSGNEDQFWEENGNLVDSDYEDGELIDESGIDDNISVPTPTNNSGSSSTKPSKTSDSKNKYREIPQKPTFPDYADPIHVPKDWPVEGHSKRKISPNDTQAIQKLAFIAMDPAAGWQKQQKKTGYASWGHNLVYQIGDQAQKAIYKEIIRLRHGDTDSELNRLVAKYSNQRDKLLKEYNFSAFKTGGYTGDWADSSGRIGILHEKELILNQSDTKNILSAVNIVRSMDELLRGIGQSFNTLGSSYNVKMRSMSDGLNQNVTISANFPNVNSREQIENAFNNLVNRASQYAYNTRR